VIAIIVHIDKTILDGLRKYSAFPVCISLANYSWDVYNLRSGMELVGLLPQPEGDPDWPVEGYKPKSEGLWDRKRFFMHSSLGILFKSTKQASYTGFEFMDPDGVKRKGVPFIYVISKDLGEASFISGVGQTCCDSCLVPPNELNQLRHAVETGYPARTEAAMTPLIEEILNLKENLDVPQVRVTEKCKKYGVHPVMVSSLNCAWP
jgi:hypothetical protein